jgi:hypothetical protein
VARLKLKKTHLKAEVVALQKRFSVEFEQIVLMLYDVAERQLVVNLPDGFNHFLLQHQSTQLSTNN